MKQVLRYHVKVSLCVRWQCFEPVDRTRGCVAKKKELARSTNQFNWITWSWVSNYLGKTPIKFTMIVLWGIVVTIIPERMKGVITGIGYSYRPLLTYQQALHCWPGQPAWPVPESPHALGWRLQLAVMLHRPLQRIQNQYYNAILMALIKMFIVFCAGHDPTLCVTLRKPVLEGDRRR